MAPFARAGERVRLPTLSLFFPPGQYSDDLQSLFPYRFGDPLRGRAGGHVFARGTKRPSTLRFIALALWFVQAVLWICAEPFFYSVPTARGFVLLCRGLRIWLLQICGCQLLLVFPDLRLSILIISPARPRNLGLRPVPWLVTQ